MFSSATTNLRKKIEYYTQTDLLYVLSGGFWSNLNFVFSSILAFILSVAFAYYIPKESYGLYQYILSLSAIFTAFSLTGMNSSITRSVAQGYDGSFVKSIGPQLKWGLLSSGISLITALYYFIQGAHSIALALFFVSIFLPIINTTNTYTALFIGKRDFKQNFIFNTSFNFIYTIIMVIVIIYTQNPITIVITYFLVAGLVNLFLFLKSIQKNTLNTLTDPDTLPYAKHLSVMNIVGVIANKIDSILVFQFIGPMHLALYTFAKIIPEKTGGAFKSFTSIAFPKFAIQEKHDIHKTILRRTFLLSLLAVGISVGYIFIAPFLFNLFLPAYTDAIIYSQVLSLSLIGSAASLPMYALMSQKSTKELYIINMVYPLTQLALIFIMMYFWGIWGLIYSKIISSIIYVCLTTYTAYTYTNN